MTFENGISGKKQSEIRNKMFTNNDIYTKSY